MFDPHATYSTALDKSWIRCRICGWVSHNTNDVMHLYCSRCHAWHEDREMEKQHMWTTVKVLGVVVLLVVTTLLLLPKAEAKVMVCRNAYTGAFVSAAFKRTNPHVRVICKLV